MEAMVQMVDILDLRLMLFSLLAYNKSHFKLMEIDLILF